jgi:LacI family transcriptional regulator
MKRQRLIAVVFPEHGLWREVLLGFHEASINTDWVLWHVTTFSPNSRELVRNSEASAMLIAAPWHEEVLAAGLGKRVMVAAELDLTQRGIPSVRVDDPAIGRAAADHLLDQGQRDFSAFGWPEPFYLARQQGFAQRVIERGGRFHERWNATDYRFMPGENDAYEKSIRTWIDRLPRPCAILCGADVWGRQLNLILYRWGIRVPEDFATIGVDNDTLPCATSIPPLSSVAVPWRRVGAEAARLMADALAKTGRNRKTPPLVLVPPSGVVVRRSSDMLAVSDQNVSDALRVIRNRATEAISISDILRQVPIGRHALQRAFRRHVGRTMLDEIHRVRVERAKSVLATTDLGMPEVALSSGFASAARLAKVFRRETGTTPGDYRRAFRNR